MAFLLDDELSRIVLETPWLLRALRTVRELDPPSWCIGGGALRNAVWDALHGYKEPSFLADLDVVYFDPSDVSAERDRRLEGDLNELEPDLPWDVKNQAGVHLWFESIFGHPAEPLTSLEDAVASWPETATAVAVRLDERNQLTVIAPFGLGDLFNMVVRRNPRRVSASTYRERIDSKRYTDRWPRVHILPS